MNSCRYFGMPIDTYRHADTIGTPILSARRYIGRFLISIYLSLYILLHACHVCKKSDWELVVYTQPENHDWVPVNIFQPRCEVKFLVLFKVLHWWVRSGRSHQDHRPQFLQKIRPSFGHSVPFLVPDGPLLALPGLVLTPSTSRRPGLNCNDLFDPIFEKKS